MLQLTTYNLVQCTLYHHYHVAFYISAKYLLIRIQVQFTSFLFLKYWSWIKWLTQSLYNDAKIEKELNREQNAIALCDIFMQSLFRHPIIWIIWWIKNYLNKKDTKLTMSVAMELIVNISSLFLHNKKMQCSRPLADFCIFCLCKRVSRFLVVHGITYDDALHNHHDHIINKSTI